jgi:hypothetical protein
MSDKQMLIGETRYIFHYDVETSLWKNPFKKTITDELEYAKFKQQNAYHDLKHFDHADPLTARKQAFDYLRSMIEVMCESIGKPYSNYWQAVSDLQPLLRADHPLAHQRLCNIQFDDDLLCGVSLTLLVEKGKKHDRVAIFNLGVYDDNHKEEILSDVVYSIVELERERRYYNLARIPVKTEKIDLSGIGMADAEVMPSLMDWKEFTDTFADTDIDAVLDTSAIYDRQCELLIM